MLSTAAVLNKTFSDFFMDPAGEDRTIISTDLLLSRLASMTKSAYSVVSDDWSNMTCCFNDYKAAQLPDYMNRCFHGHKTAIPDKKTGSIKKMEEIILKAIHQTFLSIACSTILQKSLNGISSTG